MRRLVVFVESVGVIGPGFANWCEFEAVFGGSNPLPSTWALTPSPLCLPANERRRAGSPVRLALAVGQQAVAATGRDPTTLATVFASSGGDGDNCHALCETLATNDRQISPTRFHNSVHNAPSGYWGIAMGATASSTSVCAYDASFSAGLLEAAVQVEGSGDPCLLVAYDVPYPFPMSRCRDLGGALAIALVVVPGPSDRGRHQLTLGFGAGACTEMEHPDLERLRRHIPAARGLPLLQALTHPGPSRVVLEYLDSLRLIVEVCQCPSTIAG